MTVDSLRAILGALETARVRYIIIGGIAVAAHGYVRYTVDLDLVIALDPENVLAAAGALGGLGYRSMLPVKLEDLGNPEIRHRWAREKGMVVFQLVSDQHQETPVDIFVTPPFDFDVQHARALRLKLAGNVDAVVLALDELVRMKSQVDRPKDQLDVDQLRRIQEPPA